MNQTDAKKELQTLANKTPSLQVLWLYGSRAKGNAEANSDYDLAAAFSNRESLPDYYSDQLASDWAQKTGLNISIVDINAAPVPLSYNIIQDGVVLYSNSDLRQHSEESRVWSLWEEYEREYKRING
jgi:predicted nucleotidyltransferase